ncbi:hypothetical protein DIRU0_C14246 [Diutina rugosa]
MKLLAGIVVLVSVAYYYFVYRQSPVPAAQSPMSVAKIAANTKPFPAYFFSHGAPSFLYEDDDFGDRGAWKTVKKIGRLIKKWQPDYIIVVSAHWQSTGSNLVEVNVADAPSAENKLIYDFYGFPKYMYQEEFHSLNAPVIGEQIKAHLEKNGFNSRLTKRGLDHGAWVPLKVAFSDYNTKTNPQPEEKGLDLPDTAVIQVSLTANDRDIDAHFRLGQVLNYFRTHQVWDESKNRYARGLIVCSGMTVHNLGDIGRGLSAPGGVMPYTKPFNRWLTSTLTGPGDKREAITKLQKENPTLLYNAHPSLEHFLPAVVGAGVASENDEPIKELYNNDFSSMGWGIFQFGKDYTDKA